MSLSARNRRALSRIGEELVKDPELASLATAFNHLMSGEEMPETRSGGRRRLRKVRGRYRTRGQSRGRFRRGGGTRVAWLAVTAWLVVSAALIAVALSLNAASHNVTDSCPAPWGAACPRR